MLMENINHISVDCLHQKQPCVGMYQSCCRTRDTFGRSQRPAPSGGPSCHWALRQRPERSCHLQNRSGDPSYAPAAPPSTPLCRSAHRSTSLSGWFRLPERERKREVESWSHILSSLPCSHYQANLRVYIFKKEFICHLSIATSYESYLKFFFYLYNTCISFQKQ